MIDCNEAYSKTLGYKREELLQMRRSEFLIEDDDTVLAPY
jgi:PAS domain-containing protein